MSLLVKSVKSLSTMKLHLTFLRHEGETLMTHSSNVSARSMNSRIQQDTALWQSYPLSSAAAQQRHTVQPESLEVICVFCFWKTLSHLFIWAPRILPKPCISLRWHCGQQTEDWICFYSLSGAQFTSKPADKKKKHILPMKKSGFGGTPTRLNAQSMLLNLCFM